jgi:hypothetical protein
VVLSVCFHPDHVPETAAFFVTYFLINFCTFFQYYSLQDGSWTGVPSLQAIFPRAIGDQIG